MDTQSVRDTIVKLGSLVKKLLTEAEEIYREGKRKAQEHSEKAKSPENAETNFSIEKDSKHSSHELH